MSKYTEIVKNKQTYVYCGACDHYMPSGFHRNYKTVVLTFHLQLLSTIFVCHQINAKSCFNILNSSINFI